MASPLIVAKLTVALAGREVVRKVSLDLGGPGWFGVMGANGSGKTTLLRALTGRLPVTAGRIVIGGEEVAASPGRRARLTGDAPPLDTLPASLTACELIALVARARGASKTGGVLHEALEIDRLSDVRVAHMSSGMRQRLALHLALLGDPVVVLLDEPFNWLDPVAAYDAKAQLTEYARSHALVTALHDAATFATRCTAGLLLRDGAVAHSFTSEDLQRGALDIGGFEHALYRLLKHSE